MRRLLALLPLLVALSAAAPAQDIMKNGSFESGAADWHLNATYSPQVVQSGWSGVTAADGSWFLALTGPVSVGYSYVEIASQSLTAPFGTGVPGNNFVAYLFAYTRIHTNDGRRVSYAVRLEPGYGIGTSTWSGGAQDQWVTAQTSGTYLARDPYDPASPVKPLRVVFELRDPLQTGEYLLIDQVQLYYGGVNLPEPSALAALLAALAAFALRLRRRAA